LAADYFPLLLIGSIAITGIILRHFARVSVGDVKNLLIGIATFSLRTDSSTETLFVVHVLLVCVLLAYFPLSKLMHSAASLISPTLTLVANSREERHVNVFNPSVEVLHYSDYETVFRERMIQAGLPVEEQ
jgi:nitrate reductase gamma subunit